jgi:hypothetical protein
MMSGGLSGGDHLLGIVHSGFQNKWVHLHTVHQAANCAATCILFAAALACYCATICLQQC